MADDEVTRNLKGMDELDFAGWNSADWHGVFARHYADDVLVDVHGQPQTPGRRVPGLSVPYPVWLTTNPWKLSGASA